MKLDDIMTSKEVADRLGLKMTALRQRGYQGGPVPPSCGKLGNNVIYSRQAVEDWIAEQRANLYPDPDKTD